LFIARSIANNTTGDHRHSDRTPTISIAQALTRNSPFQGYTDNVPQEQLEQENLENAEYISILQINVEDLSMAVAYLGGGKEGNCPGQYFFGGNKLTGSFFIYKQI
jgi:hypothetical protein